MKKNKIFNVGWEIFRSSNMKYLNLLRKKIYYEIKKEFNLKEKNIAKGLNNFHELSKNINDADLNQKKMNVIHKISTDHQLVEFIYKSFYKQIDLFLGNDLLVQNFLNLTIQKPNDKNPTIPHRDAPPNSFFEIVLWIPLVDCKNTKSMYVVDILNTKKSLAQLDKEPENWSKFLNQFKNKKKFPKVKFGEALFFLPFLYHGSDHNKTKETRFSLNIRFKALFSPSGRKFPLHFFRLFKISKLTSLGLKKTKEEMLK